MEEEDHSEFELLAHCLVCDQYHSLDPDRVIEQPLNEILQNLYCEHCGSARCQFYALHSDG